MTGIVAFRITTGRDGITRPAFPEDCEPHTPAPSGYLQWHEWAERMDKTHRQRQCRGCGLWAIWEPRGRTVLKTSRAGGVTGG